MFRRRAKTLSLFHMPTSLHQQLVCVNIKKLDTPALQEVPFALE
jgi:hypothetical protein